VTEIDPRTGLSIGTVHVGAGPTQIVVANGYVWVANSGDNTVSKIDPSSDTVLPGIPAGNGPDSLATTQGVVWVANEYSQDVWRIDAVNDKVTREVGVAGAPTSLAAVGRTLWVGTRPLVRHQGGVLILLHTTPLHIDPALNLDVAPFQADGLTRDPLVAYNHVGGEEGSLLVPDLAVAVPQVTQAQTVYTFRIRKGILYSDGQVVHAGDVRREIERLYRLGSPGSTFFNDIVGTRTCTRKRCDLSQGIVVDNLARTLSFHLVRPDPSFLSNLTIGGLATPVPPGTPWHDVHDKPIPATGPYEIAQANRREIVYVRNPYFRAWSHAAQPAGNPDRIVMRFGYSETEEAEMVARGAADWTNDGVPAALVTRFEARYPAQFRILPQSQTDFMNFNTRVPPFNDVRVREALNFAIDRKAVAQLYGGREFATPTCQLLPPGLLGYRHFCPYATSLAHARRLVAESHTRGERVVVWGLNDGSGLARAVPYVVRVLRELGYRATSHLASGYPAGQRSYRTTQIAATADLDNSPENFFADWAACDSAAAHGWACDPAVDRTIQKDATLEASDPRAAGARWAMLDRELMRRADWLPLVNPQAVDFVSARVAGYEYNPEPGLRVVADQLWLH
jgi:YVTN family beta-propeller protein